MSVNANRGSRSQAPSEDDGFLLHAQEQFVRTQGKLIEAVMTMQEPMTDALRKTFAIAGDVIGKGQGIAPFDKLLDIQLDFVHKLFDAQVGLANMIFEAQSDLMKLPRRAEQPAIDLRTSSDEASPVASTAPRRTAQGTISAS